LVLDTSAFLQGFNSLNKKIVLYTSPLVIQEIHDEMTKIKVNNWTDTGKLIVQIPKSESIQYILTHSMRMGETKALSETDINVLALTYQLSKEGFDVTLISDDYSIQNLANELGLVYTGLATRGIKRKYYWIYYCPGCKKQFNKLEFDNLCPICGTELKRKPKKESKIRGVG
jgi:UPF0271 protein